MQYHEAVDFLFGLRRFAMRPGVESTREFLSHLGDPQESFDCVQVAGSNGKGSTARMVESVLGEAGRRVGLYTSPHLENVRERVRVDGRMVTERALVEFTEQARPYVLDQAAAGTPLTFFEVVTALGLWYFDREDVDVAVLEVGLGGEYDATSAVHPVATAVTNVTLDHTDVLGESIEDIARTKARIATGESPLVTAATGEALAVVREVAGDVVTVGEEGTGADVAVRYDGRLNHAESGISVAGDGWSVEARVPLLGDYQAQNAGVAAALARQVGGGDVDETVLVRGLRSAHWPGRFEVVEQSPLVVLDGAHNPGACEETARTLAEFEYDDLHVVFGAMHDKDHRGMAAALPPAASVVTCRPDLDRAEDPAVLANVFEAAGASDVAAGEAVADALESARERAGPDDCVLVTGSLFTVATARTPYVRVASERTVRDAADAEAVLAGAHVPAETVETAAAAADHHVVRTVLERRQAVRLRERALELDAGCAVSGIDSEGELVDAVVMGTGGQLDRLLAELSTASLGLSAVADAIERALAAGGDRPRHGYPWEDRPAVMGILNVTPDSFHDGGEYEAVADAVERAEAMVAAGADIVDVGGESTRPGADPVSADVERDRVLPVVEAIAGTDAMVSIDTRKASVGAAALDAGADMLNDVTGLADPEMRFLAAERNVPVVVMHSIDAPVVPGKDVTYDDVVRDVIEELRERVFLAEKAGIPRENVLVDPGIGFGKTGRESFDLLDRLDEFAGLGCPLLVGHSHKSMFGLVDCGPDERLPATVAATALAVDRGADVVRVHDVPENVAAVRTALAARDPHGFEADD
jgi:dihydropteroate synthase